VENYIYFIECISNYTSLSLSVIALIDLMLLHHYTNSAFESTVQKKKKMSMCSTKQYKCFSVDVHTSTVNKAHPPVFVSGNCILLFYGNREIFCALYKSMSELSYVLLTAGGWAASHCMWDPQLCCS
jgi:hypothetical protein